MSKLKSTVKTFRAPCTFIVKGLPASFDPNDKGMVMKLEEVFSFTTHKQMDVNLKINNIMMVNTSPNTRMAVVQFKNYIKSLRKLVVMAQGKTYDDSEIKIKVFPFRYPNKFLHPEYFQSTQQQK